MSFTYRQRYQKNASVSGVVPRVRRPWLGAAIVVFALGQPAAQANVRVTVTEVVSDARQSLIDARDAVEKKQWTRLATLAPAASQDPMLGDYATYWMLRRKTQDQTQPVPVAEIERFIANSKNPQLVERLKGEWIIAAARSGDFSTAARLGPNPSGNAQVQCALLLAQHMTGQAVSAEQALSTFQAGQSCWMMMDQLQSSKVVGWNDLVPQVRAMLEANRTGNAQRMAAIIFSASDMVQYAALVKDPKKWLAGRKAPSTRTDTELVTLALGRLARDKDRAANANMIQTRWEKALPAESLQWVWSQFGLTSALNVEPGAYQWYRKSGDGRLTDYNHAWQVRAELRRADIDWTWVERAVRRMSPEQQSETAWAYWLGRALAAQGKADDARQQYESIRHVMDFYGQLASEELGVIQAIPPLPEPVSEQDVAQVRELPGLQRAVALFDLDWRTEAVQEWVYALRGMSDRQLRAAAEYARQEQIFDRVINTSLLTRDEVDVSQRFIAPFEGRVSEKAKEIGLDAAWVYGLIRQESRFITNARSRVGASGLMQLMPATAKWVAGKIGMKDFKPSSVNDFDTNTILGTRYLDMVLRDLGGSQVLASAGYNAGPGRPVRWRATLPGPVEGAIFAETIPFTETRLYVKHVLSNAVYYATLFTGEPHSLKERLGTISPAPQRKVALP
ncbi:lytic transglycosylase domain-containing protein [Paracandidimonas soli]|uniref:Soluble lytic murein transglycosylase n=1 Tax=Paracandidimonas soli TaxID=1917182 RepID=A0A4R3VGS0_9BURK|nr:lytic transglycosylase domain-containing protein [Paracandidimonas soli]TCV02954.1 soluble lytic murein transglycosylase [Paracandidimonas soli]